MGTTGGPNLRGARDAHEAQVVHHVPLEVLVHQRGYRRPGAYVGIYCKVLKGGELKTGEGVVSQRPRAFR